MTTLRYRKRGFTLVEVMFSIAVLAIASLGVMGVLTYGVVTSEYAGTFSEATQLSREIIENVRVDRLNFNPFDPPAGLVDADMNARTALNAAPLDIADASIDEDTRFTRNIQITYPEVDRMARIQVRIYWVHKGSEKFVETVAFARSGQ